MKMKCVRLLALGAMALVAACSEDPRGFDTAPDTPSGGGEDSYASPTNLAVRIHLGRDEYPWAERLTEDILLCEVEALKYIKKGKRLGMEEFLIAA